MKKKIGIYLVNTIGVVSGILTIITFMASVFDISFQKIYINIDINYFLGDWSILIFAIAFIILIVSILIKLNIKKKEVLAKESFFMEFGELLQFIQKFYGLQNRMNNFDIDLFMIGVLERMRKIISIYSKRPITAKVMTISEQNGEQIMKTRWISSSIATPSVEMGKLYRISENTKFGNWIKDKMNNSYFYISGKDRVYDGLYKNSKLMLKQKHSSLLVVPIKKIKENEEKVVGFLSLDLSDKNVFDINGGIVISMAQTVVSYLGVVIKESDFENVEI